jgi:hypothetical protein
LTAAWIFFIWRLWKRKNKETELGGSIAPGSREISEYQTTELDGTGMPLGELDAGGLNELPGKHVVELEGKSIAELDSKGVPEFPGYGSFSQVTSGQGEYKQDIKVDCADESLEDAELRRLGVNGT